MRMTYTATPRTTRVIGVAEFNNVVYAELLNDDHMRKLMRRIKKAKTKEEIRRILNEPIII